MTYYHISPKDNEPKRCAGPDKCRFKSQHLRHFDNLEEARDFSEKVLEKEHGVFKNVSSLDKKFPYVLNRYVVKPEDSKVIKKPELTDTGSGVPSFTGGKLQEALDSGKPVGFSTKDVAGFIRNDIKKAIEIGELPNYFKYSVRKNSYGNIDILVSKKEGNKSVPVDKTFIYRKFDKERALDYDHPGSYSKEDRQAYIYCQEHPEYADKYIVKTDEAMQLKEYLEALGSQWGHYSSNPMIDYFNSNNMAYVEFNQD